MTSRLKVLLRRFQTGENGAIAIIFALSLIPLILAVGAAVDGARLYILKSQLQALADAAAISAGSDPFNNSEIALDTVVTAYVNANRPPDSFARVRIAETTYEAEEQRYTLLLEGTMDTSFMRIMNIDELTVVAQAEILRALPGPIELSMALDVTISMGSPLISPSVCEDGSSITTRIQALQCAVTVLIDDLSSLVTETSSEKMKVGIVPFGNHVNVGTDRAGVSWLSGSSSDWSGCVGFRDSTRRVHLDDPTNFKYPRVPVVWGMAQGCQSLSRKIQPLTEIWEEEDRDRLKQAVGTGGAGVSSSHLPSGLLWAWQLLHNEGPDPIFTEGRTKEDLDDVKGKKVVVLFTDGWNNTGPFLNTATFTVSSTAAAVTNANANQATICQNIKNAKIELFVVSFLTVNNQVEEDRLRSCASSARHFFKVQTADELITAFRNVAVAFRPVRLTD